MKKLFLMIPVLITSIGYAAIYATDGENTKDNANIYKRFNINPSGSGYKASYTEHTSPKSNYYVSEENPSLQELKSNFQRCIHSMGKDTNNYKFFAFQSADKNSNANLDICDFSNEEIKKVNDDALKTPECEQFRSEFHKKQWPNIKSALLNQQKDEYRNQKNNMMRLIFADAMDWGAKIYENGYVNKFPDYSKENFYKACLTSAQASTCNKLLKTYKNSMDIIKEKVSNEPATITNNLKQELKNPDADYYTLHKKIILHDALVNALDIGTVYYQYHSVPAEFRPNIQDIQKEKDDHAKAIEEIAEKQFEECLKNNLSSKKDDECLKLKNKYITYNKTISDIYSRGMQNLAKHLKY